MNVKSNEKYNVTVEFEKFSKRFANVDAPRYEVQGPTTLLVIEDRNRTHHFVLNQVQFFSMEVAYDSAH